MMIVCDCLHGVFLKYSAANFKDTTKPLVDLVASSFVGINGVFLKYSPANFMATAHHYIGQN